MIPISAGAGAQVYKVKNTHTEQQKQTLWGSLIKCYNY